MFKYQEPLLTYLFSKSDKNYDYSFTEAIGVRVPILEKVAKEICKEDLAFEYLETYEKSHFETNVIYGMLCGYIKTDEKIRLNYLNRFVGFVDGWAVCDLSVARWKFIKKNKPFYLEWVKQLIESHHPWNQRVGYVILLSYYLEDDDVNDVVLCLKQPICEDYYASMGAAWLISMGLVKQRDVFLKLLNEHSFSDFIYQKALQKAVESFRSSKEDKELYRQMKKARRN